MSVSSPAYTCSASADTATGSAPSRSQHRARRSCSASATAISSSCRTPRRAEQRDDRALLRRLARSCRSPAPPSCSPAPPAASARRSLARCSGRGARADPHRAASRRARAARGRARRARARRRPQRAAPRSSASSREAGEVDILVANAGAARRGRLESFTTEEIDRALDVNLRAPIALAHALLPGMLERGRGHLAVHVLDRRQVDRARRPALPRDEVRPARLRRRAAHRPARERRWRLGRVPRFHPRRGHVRRLRRQAAAGRRHAQPRGRRATASCARSSATAARSTSPRFPCAWRRASRGPRSGLRGDRRAQARRRRRSRRTWTSRCTTNAEASASGSEERLLLWALPRRRSGGRESAAGLVRA